MGAVTIPVILFCIYAFLLQTANSLALFKAEDEEESLFKTVCSTNCQDPENWNDTLVFPLYMCSCSPSCATYEDCCYDSPYRKETTWEKHDSMCVSVFDRGQYRVISGCPADKISDFCHASIGHLPPVTSRRTNTTYANVFCASCNEDADRLITWNVQLRCASDKKDDPEDVYDSTTLIYQSNHIWRMSQSTNTKSLCMFYAHFENFSVLDDLELRPCDDERKVSDCSSSWRDAEIIKLCRSYEDPVYFGSRLFRNMHCAQCNYMDPIFARCMPFSIEVMLKMGLTDPRQAEFCRNRGSKACVDYLEGSKGWGYPLSGLMNIYDVGCVPEPESQKCCPGTKYDFKSRTCRRVTTKK